jgi:hypothetical protein
MVPGYPKTYSLLAAFDSYPAVTVNDWHKMETDPREERIEAFKTYVNNAESIDVDDTAINDMYRASPETPDEIAEL